MLLGHGWTPTSRLWEQTVPRVLSLSLSFGEEHATQFLSCPNYDLYEEITFRKEFFVKYLNEGIFDVCFVCFWEALALVCALNSVTSPADDMSTCEHSCLEVMLQRAVFTQVQGSLVTWCVFPLHTASVHLHCSQNPFPSEARERISLLFQLLLRGKPKLG